MDLLEDSTDWYLDIEVASGTDLYWSFQVQPLDLTGATASFVLDSTPVAMSVVVTGADDPVSTLAVHIAPGALPAVGLYDYQVLVTFAGGQVLPYGHGKVLVR